MRIAVVVPKFPVRSQTFVYEHVRGLLGRGYSVTVVAVQGKNLERLEALDWIGDFRIEFVDGARSAKWMRVLGLLYSLVFGRVWWSLRRLRVVGRILAGTLADRLFLAAIVSRLWGQRFDVIHAHFGTMGAALSCLPEVGGRKIVTWHGFDLLEAEASGSDSLFEDLFNSSDWCHTVNSEYSREKFRLIAGQEPRVAKVRMGIIRVEEELGEGPREGVAQSESLRIVSVGRFVDCKDHFGLVRIVAELISEGLPVMLDLVGSGDGEEQVRDFLKGKPELTGKIRLHGGMTHREVLSLMQDSDLFVLKGCLGHNGRAETQGVVFGEAQTMGLPVIGCDVGGTKDSFVDGKTGILCDKDKPEDVAAAIRYFLKNPDKIREFGEAGMKFVQAEFSMELMIDSFERLYRGDEMAAG